MNAMPDAQLCHIGLYAFDLEKMVDFYSRIFGLVVTDRGHSEPAASTSRFSAAIRSSIIRSPSPPAGPRTRSTPPSTRFRSAFRASRTCGSTIRWLVRSSVKKLDPRNHGNAWSIYFADPEGNRVELYCSSPWHVSQPFGEPLDLTEPAETIRAKTEAMVKQDPTCQPMDVWVAQMKKKMSAEREKVRLN